MARVCVQATWDDVPHLSAQAKADLYESIPPHQRDARTKGIPQLGSGAIYPIAEEDVLCEPFQIPVYFRHAYALDVGWKRTAALWGAYDGDNDVVYIYAEHYRGLSEPAVHAAAIRARGSWIPGVADPASRISSQADGDQLLRQYQALDLNLTLADNSVEAGIFAVWQRLSTGRLKVFTNCKNFLAEFRIYRRDDKGKVVKENDHLMDCLRYLVMSGIKGASYPPSTQWSKLTPRGNQSVSDYDPSAWNRR